MKTLGMIICGTCAYVMFVSTVLNILLTHDYKLAGACFVTALFASVMTWVWKAYPE